MPPARSPVAEVLSKLSDLLAALGIRYYLFGAQAALLHGAARLTADIDITVDLGTQPTSTLANALQAAGFELRVSDPAFVDRTRVLPVADIGTGLPVDIVLAGPGLEELFFERAERRIVEGVSVSVVSAEDLIAMKILAGRPKDIEDVRAILGAHPSGLDHELVRTTLEILEQALDRRDLISVFQSLVASRPP